MNVLLTGGGTGGHIYPALAIANHLKEKYPDIKLLYVGTAKGLESTIVPKNDIPFATISVEGLPRKLSPQLIKAGLKAIAGGVEAIKVVRKFDPDLVIGTGGYVCGPVILAAKLLHKPAIIHEQNAFPGVTNRLLAGFADQVMVNFIAAKDYFKPKNKIVETGLPVRQEVFNISKAEGLAYLGLAKDKVTLLVSGGSLGARSINQAMAQCYPDLVKHKELQIIHLTGKNGYQETLGIIKKLGIDLNKQKQIILKPYLHEMEYALNAADFCIGRAGATFLAELTACGLASILVPYPFASENHQQYNAQALVDAGAAMMILDQELSKETLLTTIIQLTENVEIRQKMAQQAKEIGDKEALHKIIALLEPYLQK